MSEGKERIGVGRIWSGSVAVCERLAAPPHWPSRCGVVSLRLVVIPLLPQRFHHRDTPSLIRQEPQLVMSIHEKAALRYETENPRNETLLQPTDKERSRLLSLPAEVRDAIYSWTLASTQITYGEISWTSQTVKPTVNKSHPYALALLRTCRLINQEIGLRWIKWAAFNFESSEALLDTLTIPPTAFIAALRHVRVSGEPIMLSLPHNDVYYRLPWTLKLVPNLQLDTLTVLGGRANGSGGGSAQVGYTTVDEIITYGTG